MQKKLNIKADLKNKIDGLPKDPGVYQFIDPGGRILYIGKAINLRNRVRQYFNLSSSHSKRISSMVSRIADIITIVTDSEIEALILEATLIKERKPHYNIDLKDDKTYPYIVITSEPFPRVFVTRKIINDRSKYFGPFTEVNNMRESLKMVRDIFKVRSCNFYLDEKTINAKKVRLCLDYHIKKCDGPCEGLISNPKYNEMIDEVAQLLKGKTKSLSDDLRNKMETASVEMRYEDAALMRDKIRQLNVYSQRQKIITADPVDRDLFATAESHGNACGIVFNIREGKIIGTKHIYMSRVEDKNPEEVLESFIKQYYLGSDDIPPEIFTHIPVNDAGIIQDWLSQKSKQKVSISSPKIGDKYKLMLMCRSNARLLLTQILNQKQERKLPSSLSALMKDLKMVNLPRRIECFDVSNLKAADIVASMVVFVDGRPRKSGYRKYKVRNVVGQDDYGAMREVIERRYKRALEESSGFPDLIIIDGGKGHLMTVLDVLRRIVQSHNDLKPVSESLKMPDIISIAKKLEEIYSPGEEEPLSISKSSPGLRLIQRLRDEAHRFAISYHRLLRGKRFLSSELDLINGIGKKRAKILLETFGSVQGIKFATTEQLTATVGEKYTEMLMEYFRWNEDDGRIKGDFNA